MVRHCCVPQCNNTFKKGRKFHNFPRNRTLRKQWKTALQYGKEPNKDSKVCSDHFKKTDYKISDSGLYIVLKSGTIPSVNLPKQQFDKIKIKDMKLLLRTEEHSYASQNVGENEEYPETEFISLDDTGEIGEEIQESSKFTDSVLISIPKTVKKTFVTRAIQANRITTLNSEMLFNNMSAEDFKYFTGFEKDRFLILYRVIKTFSTSYDFCMDCKDQLILTLIKYRHALDFGFFEKMYRIDRTVASNIFSLWTEIIYKYLRKIDFWGLKCTEPWQYSAIIDFTEIFTERSASNLLINQHLFSNYKNHNTFKYLLAVDANGLVIFCSNVYGGSKSNEFIIEHSKFINLTRPGNILLADRDLNVSDMLKNKKCVAVKMPSLETKSQVERVVNLTKKNKILCNTIPSSLWPQINEIVYNCTMLCNFEEYIAN